MNAPVLQVPGTLQISALHLRMKGFYWLIRREFWEHQRRLVWMPAMLGVLSVALGVLSFLLEDLKLFVGPLSEQGTEPFGTTVVVQMAAIVGQQLLASILPVVLLFVVPAFTVFFYCLEALQDDRRDRSILFWKSLPTSNAATVLSKACVALVIAPVIGWGIYYVCAWLLASLPSKGNEFAFHLTLLQIYGVLPIYVLWALPTVGWLLLVSAWARSRPFLWAIGVPVFTVWLAQWSNEVLHYSQDTQWLWSDVLARSLLSGSFAAWFTSGLGGSPDLYVPLSLDWVVDSWRALGLPSLWIGAIAGIAMIATAIRLRRWRTAD
jgi:ABC-2 type transport system permease protein